MKLRKFQDGGQMVAEDPNAMAAGAPVEGGVAPADAGMQGGADPLMEIAQMMAQGLQAQDCNMLAQACQAFLGLLQQAQGGAEQAQPVFKKGGKLVKRTANVTLVRK